MSVFLCQIHEAYMSKVDKEVAKEIMALAKLDKNSFKDAIENILNSIQKANIVSLMDAYAQSESPGSVEEAIQLKSFN